MAISTRLPLDATLRSVMPSLDNRFAFIPAAYAVMNKHNRVKPVVLRLGVSSGSKGKLPNYRLDDAETLETVIVINGSNHEKWPGDDWKLSDEWSSAVMTFAEVKQLVVEVREDEKIRGKR